MPVGPPRPEALSQHAHAEHTQTSKRKHAGLEGVATFLNFLDFPRCRSPRPDAPWAPESQVRSSRGGAGHGQPSGTQGRSGVSSCT